MLPLTQDDQAISRIDWRPLVKMLSDDTLDAAYRARCFHETLAQCISELAVQYRKSNRNTAVGLSGGVFQNRLLVQLIKQRLDKHNIKFYMPSKIPVNDGGLSAGQIIEYHYQ